VLARDDRDGRPAERDVAHPGGHRLVQGVMGEEQVGRASASSRRSGRASLRTFAEAPPQSVTAWFSAPRN
jgi:hypothetical protein